MKNDTPLAAGRTPGIVCFLVFAAALSLPGAGSAQSPSGIMVPATPAPVVESTPTAATPAPARILYPASQSPLVPAPGHGAGGSAGAPGLAGSFLMLLALCAGGYYLLRRRSGAAFVGKGARKLVISETRSLGNRQFLVVVEYENARLLLGVTPGKIDYLCPLGAAVGPVSPTFAEHLS